MKRNNGIDLMKYIAAILVVGIHTTPFKSISDTASFYFTDIICRIAVPYFIICSGYYMGTNSKYDDAKEKLIPNKQYLICTLKKLTKSYIGISVLYLLLQIPQWIESGWFSSWAFVDWGIGFFKNGSYYHLWYLICLIYAIPVCVFLLYKIKFRYIPVVMLGLYGLEILEYAYRIFLPEAIKNVFEIYDLFGCVSIAITRVVPFLLLGVLCARKEEKSSYKKYFAMFLVAFCMMFLEANLLRKCGQIQFSYMISTFVATYFFFCFVLEYGVCELQKYDFHKLSKVSTVVYFIHPAVLYILRNAIAVPHVTEFLVAVTISSLMGNGYCIWKETRLKKI